MKTERERDTENENHDIDATECAVQSRDQND